MDLVIMLSCSKRIFSIPVLILAFDPTVSDARSLSKDWDFFVGVGIERSPEYEGSDQFETGFQPGLQAIWRDRLAISSGGVELFLFNDQPYNATIGLGYGGGRDESDSAALSGLGDIDAGLTVSLGGQYDLGVAVATIDVTRFTKGSEGTLVSLGLQSDVPFGVITGGLRQTGNRIDDEGLVITGGLSLDWADSNYGQSFFGVTAVQSASSGLRTFDAGSGFKSVDATIGFAKPLGRNWGITGEVTYSVLLGDARNSPLTRQRDSLTYALGISFNF